MGYQGWFFNRIEHKSSSDWGRSKGRAGVDVGGTGEASGGLREGHVLSGDKESCDLRGCRLEAAENHVMGE